MTTFQRKSILSEIFSEGPISQRTLTYFRARLSNRIHAMVLEEFARQEQAKKITKAELGRKISRKPEQITRWLGSPGNWTLDTVSDLLLGMGYEPNPSLTELSENVGQSENWFEIGSSPPINVSEKQPTQEFSTLIGQAIPKMQEPFEEKLGSMDVDTYRQAA